MTTDDRLERRIRHLIETAGPIPVSDYMATCLFDPELGYYTTREPFGASGDFITAPEISQMFGEIVGAWLIHAWRMMGRPTPFALVEIGPGRGTLMRDILRTARLDPAFAEAAQPWLVEVSPRLRDIQRDTLAEATPRCEWSDDVSGLPNLPMLIVANELFDAVPFRQIVKSADAWRERMVSVADDGKLAFVAGATSVVGDILPPGAAEQPDGAVFEFAPAREALASRIAARLTETTGAALFLDYGHAEPGFGDTFQALRGHAPAGVFDTPGQCDLTSHVDFSALTFAATAAGASAKPVITQGEFLLSLGLAERAGALGANADAARRDEIRVAAGRLAGAGENQMGSLFKVLCIAGQALDLPPFARRPDQRG
ncbi:class I SAM-dependent methyltransferase [Oricola sp.]|uniref:class I SAM-dependent methyltransferase n=1 Tax=Oricola sp. TaxID=1979950 RepID=UPI003BAD06DE